MRCKTLNLGKHLSIDFDFRSFGLGFMLYTYDDFELYVMILPISICITWSKTMTENYAYSLRRIELEKRIQRKVDRLQHLIDIKAPVNIIASNAQMLGEARRDLERGYY